LQGLPVDKIKIDKCFVEGVGRSRDAEPIVRAMIALGRSLGLTVVAEGVENQEQLDSLAAEDVTVCRDFFWPRRCRRRIWRSCWASASCGGSA
jgi:EAL domain-containing protein (putative c-di-GMP-specific phosphodiesterase class I)